MSLLVVEILLAAYALTRGWRKAPALLVGLPIAVLSFEPVFAGLLGPWIAEYFEPGRHGARARARPLASSGSP